MIKLSDILKPTGVSVTKLRYGGTDTTYITYFEYMQQGGSYADNNENNAEHFMQIDVWSKIDCTDIAQQTKTLLTNAGFRRTYETEMFESDTLTYHKVIRMVINEELI